MKTYNIGDTVFVARYENRLERILCPVCFGKREVVLILGNEDQVTLPCEYCKIGFDPARGYVMEYVFLPKVDEERIIGREIHDSLDGQKVEYYAGNRILYPENMFDSPEEALIRAKELEKEAEEQEQIRLTHIKKNKKTSFAWNAGYHIREAAKNRKSAEYHECMAILCKAKAKDKGESK